MRKRTAPPTQKKGRASSQDKLGLTAKRKERKQSEGAESALDSRSHRTPLISAARPASTHFL